MIFLLSIMIIGASLSEPHCREMFEIFSLKLLYLYGTYAIPYTLVVSVSLLSMFSMWLCVQIISPSGGGAYASNKTVSAWCNTEKNPGPTAAAAKRIII